MLFILIDNEPEETLRLSECLKEAFPEAQLLPELNRTTLPIFTDWVDVNNYIIGIDEERAVLCLDLALKTGKVDFKDVERGLDQAAAIRQLRPKWIIVAYTMHARRASFYPSYQKAFDGMIDKAELDSRIERDERTLYVKNMIKAAIRRGELETDQAFVVPRIIDSLGMRLFRAAFGDPTINEIIENEASSWSSLELKALTTGHSGAFLISITGSLEGRQQSIALKIARDETVIQAEVEAPSKYIGELGPLNGRLGTLDQKKKRLSTATGVYYKQALENGKPLMELLPRRNSEEAEKILAPVVRLCIEVAAHVQPAHWGVVRACDVFKLAPIDISRLETSASFVAELGGALVDRGYWPQSIGTPAEVTRELTDLAKGWSKSKLTNVQVRTILQHGDLNPGNILVRDDRDRVPILIDLSRLGPWPVGYDLSRLALMLRLRLMSSINHADWFPDHLILWTDESVARLDRDITDSPFCFEAQYCESQYRRFITEQNDSQIQKILVYSYKLGTLWDLIKIGSYQDASAFKRVWAFIEGWKLIRTLEIHSAPVALKSYESN